MARMINPMDMYEPNGIFFNGGTSRTTSMATSLDANLKGSSKR